MCYSQTDGMSSTSFSGCLVGKKVTDRQTDRQTNSNFINIDNNLPFVNLFKTWKLKHGKSYGAARHYGWHQANEEKFRKSIWINNKDKIENHNQQFFKVKQMIFNLLF